MTDSCLNRTRTGPSSVPKHAWFVFLDFMGEAFRAEIFHFCSDMICGGVCVVCSPWPPGAYVPPFFAHLPSPIYLLPGKVVRNIYLKLEKAFNFILAFFF